jgi:ribosome-associated protein
MIQKVIIKPPFIKLEQFLKFCGAMQTGGEAKVRIQNGDVMVNNEVCTMRGKKLVFGDIVQIVGEKEQYQCVESIETDYPSL